MGMARGEATRDDDPAFEAAQAIVDDRAGMIAGLPPHARKILALDDTVNPVGVECWMRSLFHTLQGVAEEIFAGEIAYARMIEEIAPGTLRALAAGMGKAEAFDTAQEIVDARAMMIAARPPGGDAPPIR